MDKRKVDKRVLAGVIVIGIAARYLFMMIGHNYDFDSYCIVGEIAGHFRSVYAETSRYNYGFIFFCILGALYDLAHLVPGDWQIIYRILIVGVLTLTDLGIAYIIAKRWSLKGVNHFSRGINHNTL